MTLGFDFEEADQRRGLGFPFFADITSQKLAEDADLGKVETRLMPATLVIDERTHT